MSLSKWSILAVRSSTVIFFCVMAYMLLHAQDQDLAVFLEDRFDFNNKPSGDALSLSRASLSDCGEAEIPVVLFVLLLLFYFSLKGRLLAVLMCY